jgi:hypothetical protein
VAGALARSRAARAARLLLKGEFKSGRTETPLHSLLEPAQQAGQHKPRQAPLKAALLPPPPPFAAPSPPSSHPHTPTPTHPPHRWCRFEILTLMQLRKLGSKFPVPLILANYDGVYHGEPGLGWAGLGRAWRRRMGCLGWVRGGGGGGAA